MRYLIALMMLLACNLVYADIYSEISNDKIADAIYKAENSSLNPYGIMIKYKNTSPRQSCINTIKHAKNRFLTYNGEDDFITFLGKTYAPIGVKNDPKGLNRYWVRNVKYFIDGRWLYAGDTFLPMYELQG